MLRIIATVLSLVVLVVACGGGGAAEIADGSYRAFAVAEGEVPDLSLEIDGNALTFTGPGGITEASLGAIAGAYRVCGTETEDDVVEVDTAVTVDAVEWANPGIFGDCGITSPERVTLVDLDSHDEALGVVPFARWIELCDTTDPDC